MKEYSWHGFGIGAPDNAKEFDFCFTDELVPFKIQLTDQEIILC